MSLTLNQPKLPSSEDIQSWPLFQNLASERIVLLHNLEQCQVILNELLAEKVFGFDSESKPTFSKGEVSTGPHLIQLSTLNKAYLFQVNPETITFLAPILANRKLLKVGFGLKNDAQLFRKKGIELNHTYDLAKSFSSFGFKQQMGVRNAIALLFQKNFPKSKKISTSNWSKKKLSSEQIHYAAADAYAAIVIFHHLSELKRLPKPYASVFQSESFDAKT